MRKATALLLALACLYSVSAFAETVSFNDYGFTIELPEGWGYQDTTLTEEYLKDNVVYGIDAHNEDNSLLFWVEIHAFEEESRPATEVTMIEFENYINDLREFYPDMSLYTVKGIPFLIYTAGDETGTYITAYTWDVNYEHGFIFFSEQMTQDMRLLIMSILDTYTKQ